MLVDLYFCVVLHPEYVLRSEPDTAYGLTQVKITFHAFEMTLHIQVYLSEAPSLSQVVVNAQGISLEDICSLGLTFSHNDVDTEPSARATPWKLALQVEMMLLRASIGHGPSPCSVHSSHAA